MTDPTTHAAEIVARVKPGESALALAYALGLGIVLANNDFDGDAFAWVFYVSGPGGGKGNVAIVMNATPEHPRFRGLVLWACATHALAIQEGSVPAMDCPRTAELAAALDVALGPEPSMDAAELLLVTKAYRDTAWLAQHSVPLPIDGVRYAVCETRIG